LPYVLTSFAGLDEFMGGFQRSDLVIVAGRPSMGKTSLALNIVRNAAVEHRACVALFSLEMARDSLVLRLLSSESGVNSRRVRFGQHTEDEEKRVMEATGVLSESLIYVDDTPMLRMAEMRSKALRLKYESGIDLVIIDYLQLMRGTVSRADNRQQEVAEISRFLKSLAKELDIPVIALSQLSRDIEKHGNRRPQLSDLRESGAIEQDADLVTFIWRKHQKNMAEGEEVAEEPAGQASDALTELIIGKQRNGPTGTVKLIFVADYMSFSNIDWSKRTVG
jgi:replicative DNA helicase